MRRPTQSCGDFGRGPTGRAPTSTATSWPSGRLHELEDRVRADASTETNAPDTNGPETNAPEMNAPQSNAPQSNAPRGNPVVQSSPPEPAAPRTPAASPDDRPAPTVVGPKKKWWRHLGPKRVAILWISSLVAVALIVGAVTALTAPRTSTAGGVRHVGTVHPDPAFVWPEALGEQVGDAQGFTDFFGLTAVAGNGFFGTEAAETCILLLETAQIEGDENFALSPSRFGCGAGPFRATAEFVVQGELPPEMLERFPEGSALQFVLDGSRIDVYSDAE